MKRYRLVLTPCPATASSYWGKVLASADSIVELWEAAGWRGELVCSLSWDQEIVVVDAKSGKRLTEKEYSGLVNRLKGWAPPESSLYPTKCSRKDG